MGPNLASLPKIREASVKSRGFCKRVSCWYMLAVTVFDWKIFRTGALFNRPSCFTAPPLPVGRLLQVLGDPNGSIWGTPFPFVSARSYASIRL
jgi:hypothetical protein